MNQAAALPLLTTAAVYYGQSKVMRFTSHKLLWIH